MFIVNKKPKSVAAESYRTLRTNIKYSSFDNEYRCIAVTSSGMGEGKSTTAGNLAFALAQSDSTVLLVDCDLRKSSMHKHFKISNNVGLTDVLVGTYNLEETIYKYDENLNVLTAGKSTPNPSEMLGSKAMGRFLEEAKEKYDYVIIDTPPVIAVTDAQVLATKVDGTILVVHAGETKKQVVMTAVDLLKKVGGNIIGTVLNSVEMKGSNYYYYYYNNEDSNEGIGNKKGKKRRN